MTLHPPSTNLRCATLLATGLVLVPRTAPSQVIGYVPTKDATVTSAQDVLEGRAVLVGSVVVTARDHTAPVSLARGGTVRVCQTSILHLTESRAAATAPQLAAPLLLSLDRGAIEVQISATPTDALITPDLRFAVKSPGPLDLRLRVAQNGDTCVNNRGASAPDLLISDPFGEGSYLLKPNQHVLFEHGSLHEVVDHETEPCGCPDSSGVSLAEALIAPNHGGKALTPQVAQANAQHPFPAAQSEGLAPSPGVPQAPPGVVHAQVTQNLSYNGAAPRPAPATPAPAQPPAPLAPPPAPAQPQHRGVFRSIGHFFHKIFTGN